MHKANKNKDSALSNQNVKSSIEKKILEADQKPLAPALQLILGKYLEHVSNSSSFLIILLSFKQKSQMCK